ncbi:putative transglutaminase-like cysteine proteinase [Rhizomicrobium palustre]|uniref:Putative transglutaminase-like cysteine proteinase n=1 Tax=Rhizomicrobium palustre TaxID=189966 RepID=A0A846N031_9PROT|nr:transglutaminase-like cysteine peptidase [Rhizomicrobium palustre]NIK89294.1 putative transglutaminase-like cysteine proteinase [Rhizomicrobium palustre]
MTKAGTAGILAAILLLAGCAPPQPLPEPSPPLPDAGPETEPPFGAVSFCMRFEDQCAPASGPPLPLTVPSWQLLLRVNHDVNSDIWPEDDEEHYGRPEYWTIPKDGYGDCDDYAVTKRQRLFAAGLPFSILRLAVVALPGGALHTVMTITTDRGDFVLDNRSDEILAWTRTPFTWLKVQARASPWRWEAVTRASARAAK